MADSSSRAGQSYATPEILGYLARLHAPQDAALDRAFRAADTHGIPAIQVGPHEGSLLGWLARGVGARRIVEVGTLAGYSAIHLGRAVGPGGKVHSLEIDPRHAEIARENLRAAALEDRVEVLLGDAIDSLGRLSTAGPFDVVFVDADKGRYDRYASWAIEHLRPGGLLIGDNVFFFGRLLDDHPDAAAMRRFHELAAQSLDVAILPTPDGLLVGRKLQG
jgi:predicted O-methyltransferase YrrM